MGRFISTIHALENQSEMKLLRKKKWWKSFYDDFFQSESSDYSSGDEYVEEVGKDPEDAYIEDDQFSGSSESDTEKYSKKVKCMMKSWKSLRMNITSFLMPIFWPRKLNFLLQNSLQKSNLIHIFRKTLFNYRSKDMSEKSQQQRNENKGRNPKLS